MELNIDLLPCLCFAAAEDGTLLQVNDALCGRLEFGRAELIGQKAEKLFTVSTRIFQQTHFSPLLKMQGFANEIFLTLQDSAGKPIPVLVNASRLDETGSGGAYVYVGIEVQNRQRFEEELIAARNAAEAALRDNSALVTTRLQLEQHLSELDQQMSRVQQQNEELRQFNRVITHDLQEPLRKLSIFSNMLLRPDAPSTPEQTVTKLNNALEQMRLVVSGLQQYVWLTERPLSLARVELRELLQEVQNALSEKYPDVALELVAGEMDPVLADEEQLRVLLTEVFSNAIRFRKLPHKARIEISQQLIRRNKYQNISDQYQYQHYHRLELKDDGIGFDNAYREKAFGLFQRLHPESGRGLGLPLCKKIIDAHHGHISISSQEGIGTKLSILLPATLAEGADQQPAMNQTSETWSSNEK